MAVSTVEIVPQGKIVYSMFFADAEGTRFSLRNMGSNMRPSTVRTM